MDEQVELQPAETDIPAIPSVPIVPTSMESPFRMVLTTEIMPWSRK